MLFQLELFFLKILDPAFVNLNSIIINVFEDSSNNKLNYEDLIFIVLFHKTLVKFSQENSKHQYHMISSICGI